ncbi:MAG: hypothetical protein M0D57_11725 [Sphingobacteriales bacterium JAD_PAG50586_3]|nr:MAG: hypothetical protein M0D57_11725 [Sphingobacteriales bacterium JAD_PAG50586_3]
MAKAIVTTDIANFWNAYDKIKATPDTAEHYKLINTLFIDKGTPGLKAIMQAREYIDTSYVEAIKNYPNFWQSVRANTLKADQLAKVISNDVAKIKDIYPSLKATTIYFTVGALRTSGTTLDNIVLIGSEIALGDSTTIVSELPANFSHLATYFKSNPIKDIVFLNVHEYVHTQQKTTVGNHLLAQCVLEGVAEFVTVTATGKQSPTPAIAYGKANASKVRSVFEQQFLNPFYGFWLYSNADNEFNTRDLGYYVGYAICESYYNKATDKKAAIKNMIELDYNDDKALLKFIDESGYFNKPIKDVQQAYEKSRPTVANVSIKNGSKNISPTLSTLTITFSEKIDERFRNFDYGPLGENHVLRITKFTGYGSDGKSALFEIAMEPNKHYQLLVGGGWRNEKGISLQPYLIDFETGKE